MENGIEQRIGVLLGTTLLALAIAACGANYGRWSADYCNGEACRDGSPTVNRTGNVLEEGGSCPEQILESSSSVTIADIPVTFFKTLYLRDGTCVVTHATPNPQQPQLPQK
ncbi:MAG: hypothetical protein NUV65_05650 [Candidatus Roizmanbacteria bacterium]|nr:hypothetical protein [Candidatus Roizmanbacteria bacterium]